MKKIFLLVFMTALLLGLCFEVNAEEKAKISNFKVGLLAKLNINQDEYPKAFEEVHQWTLSHEAPHEQVQYIFFDNLISLIMALKRGDLDEIYLPEPVARYVLETTTGYKDTCVTRTKPILFVMGFLKQNNDVLRNEVNQALATIKQNGRLAKIIEDTLEQPSIVPTSQAEFKNFPGARTLKVAVTGDIPPIDYVSAEGKPAGFNTELIAAIAEVMKVNIEFITIDSSARSAALASKRADIVFWYQSYDNTSKQFDIPDNIMTSYSYYDVDKIIHLVRE